jgi:4-methyl-5(b-hydroxyethyl)-thiazole monophosphate biosynthesis
MARVLIPLADGCEEMEAVILIDTLRRAGWSVTSAGLKPGPVTASRGVRILPDVIWDDIRPADFDLLVLPGGGPGTENLRKDPRVLAAVREFDEQAKTVAAICAAPLVLQEAGILNGRRATCHPSVGDQLIATPRLNARVVIDHHLITSQGPGTTFEFALAIIRAVDGPGKADQIARAMVLA